MKENWKSFLKSISLYRPLRSVYGRWPSFINRIVYRKYKGRGYTCNFCGAAYMKMVPEYPGYDIEKALTTNQVIAAYGENVYCPDCGSRNAERLIKAVISSYLPIHKKKVLHCAPERRLFEWMGQFSDVSAVDGSYAANLPFRNGAFDLVIANHIFESIPDDQKAMREIHRVLSRNGAAILQVHYSSFLPGTIEYPTLRDPQQQAALFGDKEHVRIYSLDDYVLRLIQTGFRVRVLTPSELAPFRRYGIQETESVFLAYRSH